MSRVFEVTGGGQDMPMAHSLEAKEQVIAELDGCGDELGEIATETIRRVIPSYVNVPPERIRKSVRSNLARAVETLRTTKAPGERTRAEAAATTSERVRQGIPIEDIIRGYRFSLRIIHDRFIQIATAAGLPPQVMLECSNLLWEVGDWFTAIAAVEYRQHALQLAVRDTISRTGMLRDLLNGSLPEADVWRAAAVLGIDHSGTYSVVSIAGARKRLGGEPLRTDVGETADVGGFSMGLVKDRRRLTSLSAYSVGLGPMVSLRGVARSSRTASRVADLVADWSPGVYTLEDVVPGLASNSDVEIREYLDRKYIDVVREHGDFGKALLESVAAYLAADRNYPSAARALHIHPNTLRYRLSRYEETTGASLGATRTLVELGLAFGTTEPPFS